MASPRESPKRRRSGTPRKPTRNRERSRTPFEQRLAAAKVTGLKALAPDELLAYVQAVIDRLLAESALTPFSAKVLEQYRTRQLMEHDD